MRFSHTREFFIPAGAVKVADKQSDAVAFLYLSNGKPAARVFFGKQSKPIFASYFTTEARREQAVISAFVARRAVASRKAGERAVRAAFVPTFKVGDIFSTCWGYDQTNREFFQIVSKTAKTALVREVASERTETGYMTGKAVPLPGSFVGEAIRVVLREGGFKVNGHRASPAQSREVAGVRVYEPAGWSSYA